MKIIVLDGTKVTDAGVEYLMNMNLDGGRITFYNTKVTMEAAQKLQKNNKVLVVQWGKPQSGI